MDLSVVMLLILASPPDAGVTPGALSFPSAQAAAQQGPVPRNYLLTRDTKRGGWTYAQSGFRARVEPDGEVSFESVPISAKIMWLPFLPKPHPEGTRTLEGVLTDMVRGKRSQTSSDGASGPASDPLPRLSPFRPDPSEICHYPNPCEFRSALLMIAVAGTFDLTDWLMGMNGQDPYRYAKAQFMAGTAEFRARLRERARAADRSAALSALRGRLAAIARDPSSTRAQKMAALDELAADIVIEGPEADTARSLIQAERKALAPPSK